MQLPTGNTSSRPSSPVAGYLRFNTDSNYSGVKYVYWVNLEHGSDE